MQSHKTQFYQWVWNWHFIGGLISLPIVLVLAITGILYLFKEDYEAKTQAHFTKVTPQEKALLYQTQWDLARQHWALTPERVLIANSPNEATVFEAGKFSGKSSLYLNPYTGAINKTIAVRSTDMHLIRKLHGTLLLGKTGTLLVELAASWMLVLLLSGLYLFWPGIKNWKQLFRIRLDFKNRTFYRDVHVVFGFWFSSLLLLILAGGLPWTDVFGANYKWLQKNTNSGFPMAWHNSAHQSKVNGKPVPLDSIIAIANQLQLKGKVAITLPKTETGVYSISNTTSKGSAMRKVHIDQYSGKKILSLNGADIGIMMRTRLWFMAFHQGQFGFWNWILVLGVAIGLVVLSVAALFAYVKRRKAKISLPKSTFQILKSPYGLIIGLLSIALPLFGISVFILGFTNSITKKLRNNS